MINHITRLFGDPILDILARSLPIPPLKLVIIHITLTLKEGVNWFSIQLLRKKTCSYTKKR